MEYFTSILFSYKNDDRIDYQLYAEFLRLVGIYVCEDVKYPEEYEPDFERDEAEFSVCYTMEPDCEVRQQILKLQHFEQELSEHLEVGYLDFWYDDVCSIFVEQKLLQAAVTLQYFRTKADVVLQAGRQFEAAADALVDLIEKKPQYADNRHVRYAKLFCKQKANLANFLCKEPVIYYVNDLAAEGLALLDRFPDFSNAWVLLGLVYEISKDYARDAVDAFQRAIRMTGNQPYTSSIYYWLGKRCEEYVALKELEDDSYMQAHRLMPKYRNIYKVARIYMEKQEWEDALECFNDCVERLERKEHFLDPLEQEYYYKVNVHISFLYIKLKDYYNAIVSANKALEFRKNILDGKAETNEYTAFYHKMYVDNNVKDYIDLALAHMQPRQAYQYLATAYQEANMAEKAEPYWRLIRE